MWQRRPPLAGSMPHVSPHSCASHCLLNSLVAWAHICCSHLHGIYQPIANSCCKTAQYWITLGTVLMNCKRWTFQKCGLHSEIKSVQKVSSARKHSRDSVCIFKVLNCPGTSTCSIPHPLRNSRAAAGGGTHVISRQERAQAALSLSPFIRTLQH